MPEDVRNEPEAIPPEENVSRRKWLRGGLVAAGAIYAGAAVYPLYRYLADPAEEAAALAAVTEVRPEGAADLPRGAGMMFKFGTRPAVLIHHEDDTWVAFDATCTHLGCTVEYQPDQKRIHCACHGGVYDPHTGDVVSGPPPKGLTVFEVVVTGGEVVVSRVSA